jgi:glycosyltransferase involved in cell wall biosynthesis
MIVALPVCAKDEHLALANLRWCQKLDGHVDFSCVVCYDTSYDPAKVLELARGYFGQVTTFCYDKWNGEPAWPHPQNWAWQSVARYLAKQKQSWLWWEQDASPLRKGWLTSLSEAKEESGKPFLGCVMSEWDGHLNGVAIYPADIHNYTVKALLCRVAPFDVVMREEVEKFMEHTPLIQHLITTDGCSFPTVESISRLVRDDAVLFHRCKDGTLVERLEESSSWTRYIPTIFKAKPKDRKLIPIIAHLDASSGYGIFSSQMAMELMKLDYAVEIFPPSWNEIHGDIPPQIKRCMRKHQNPHDWDLIIFPCVIQPANLVLGRQSHAYFSMWESTRLVSTVDPRRTKAVDVMNKCKVILTPNAWNASIFSSCGVNTPIRICPLGFDPDVFGVTSNNIIGPMIFGTAAKTAVGGIRKGFNIVVEAFRIAFQKETDVRLKVKAFAEDPPLDTYGDTRIEVLQLYIEQAQLVEWYKSINVFVSGSASEGWGKHQHEAMCMGRPVIGVNFGGVAEFFSWENGYPVDFKLVPAQGIYESMGVYAQPSVASMARQMRRAYEDRMELQEKSLLSAKSARRFTLEHSAKTMISILKEYGFPV